MTALDDAVHAHVVRDPGLRATYGQRNVRVVPLLGPVSSTPSWPGSSPRRGPGPLEPSSPIPTSPRSWSTPVVTSGSSAAAGSSRRRRPRRRSGRPADRADRGAARPAHRPHRTHRGRPSRRRLPGARRRRPAGHRRHLPLHPAVRGPGLAADRFRLRRGCRPARVGGRGPVQRGGQRCHVVGQDIAPERPRRRGAPRERIITIEDAAELRLPGDHVVRLESRPATAEGTGRHDPPVAASRCQPPRGQRVGERSRFTHASRPGTKHRPRPTRTGRCRRASP